jgi:dihydroorotate dehydrogenase (fumarate)
MMLSVARTNTPASSTDRQAIADYVLGLKNLRAHADMFEINISCPNTYGGEPFTTPARLHSLLAAIDALHIRQPLFIKMPSNLPWSDYSALIGVIVRHNVQGVTISNLRKDRKGVAVDANIKGNLSGRPTKLLSDELIAKTYSKYGDKLTIIGVGGIFTAQDAYNKIKNGASLVALITCLIYEGPQITGQINRELAQLLKADDYTHISQAIGANLQSK